MARALIVLCVLLASTPAAAYNYVCDHGDTLSGAGRVEFPYDEENGEARVKFVFVGFPASGYPTQISYEQHAIFRNLMDDYLQKQSYGKLRLHSESGILYRPGDTLYPGSPNVDAWPADLLPSDYHARIPSGWNHPELISWLADETEHATALYAEILDRIREDYEAAEEPSPFTNVPGDDRGWELVFCFLIDGPAGFSGPLDSVFPGGADGRPGVHVKADVVVGDTDGFYDYVVVGIPDHANAFGGTGQMTAALGGVNWPQHAEAAIFYVLHEFTHTLGPLDGPPNLFQYPPLESEAKYFYGSLNLLDQHLEYFDCWGDGDGPVYSGVPPISDFWLATLPWNRLSWGPATRKVPGRWRTWPRSRDRSRANRAAGAN